MVPEGGWLLVLVRGLWVACQLSLLGSLAVPLLGGLPTPRLSRWSGWASLAAALAWLLLQADAMAGWQALPAVLLHTQFGVLLAAGAACVTLALLALRLGWPVAALLAAGAAVGLQARHSHAASMDDTGLGITMVLHLEAAGLWLGGLLPLAATVRAASLAAATRTVRRFSVLGLGCVLTLAGTAGWQGFVLVGGLGGWFGTWYGWVAVTKVVLFAALLGVALRNNRLTRRLSGPAPEPARASLVRSIAAETVLGAAVLAAASVLTALPPAMHEQPVWPFPVRPSLVTVQEDPAFAREAALAAAAIAAAALLAGTCLWRQRHRVAGLAAAAVLAGAAAPHLDLLLVPATPDSFARSPTGFSAESIARGAALFPTHCAACHGPGGHGDGPAAAGLPVPPADLTAEHLWAHDDGEMIGWLRHGIEAPNGQLAMPGFADTLPPDALWGLVDFIRARNAGLVFARTGQWVPPLRAPGLAAECSAAGTLDLSEPAGRPVLLTLGRDAAGVPGVTTCAADGAVDAYSAALGRDAAGETVLIDAAGWLRAAWTSPPGADAVADALRAVAGHPMSAPSMEAHHHGD